MKNVLSNKNVVQMLMFALRDVALKRGVGTLFPRVPPRYTPDLG